MKTGDKKMFKTRFNRFRPLLIYEVIIQIVPQLGRQSKLVWVKPPAPAFF
jgi:hypothetical protein